MDLKTRVRTIKEIKEFISNNKGEIISIQVEKCGITVKKDVIIVKVKFLSPIFDITELEAFQTKLGANIQIQPANKKTHKIYFYF